MIHPLLNNNNGSIEVIHLENGNARICFLDDQNLVTHQFEGSNNDLINLFQVIINDIRGSNIRRRMENRLPADTQTYIRTAGGQSSFRIGQYQDSYVEAIVNTEQGGTKIERLLYDHLEVLCNSQPVRARIENATDYVNGVFSNHKLGHDFKNEVYYLGVIYYLQQHT